jgi:hypothetical protein
MRQRLGLDKGTAFAAPKPRKQYDVSNRPRRTAKASGHRGLYSSTHWKRRQAAQIAAHPECVNAGTVKGCEIKAKVADHIERVTDPDSWAQVMERPIQSMCRPCHAQKSADDRAKAAGRAPSPIRRKVRIDPKTGCPLPGQDHPWSTPLTEGEE